MRATIDHNLEKLHLRNHVQQLDATSSVQLQTLNNAIQIEQLPSETGSISKHELSESHVPPSLKELFQNVISPKHHEEAVAATDSEPVEHESEQPEERTDDHKQCRLYLEKYAVIPGSSWGTLPTELQKYV